jgi:ABC-type branched-subunit amino acid transport system ATPase component
MSTENQSAGGGSIAPPAAAPPLIARGIGKRFGGVTALDDAGLTVGPGEIHALIGPNGAGKSTLVNVVGGTLTPDRGTVELFGRSCRRVPATRRAKWGLGRTFQNPALFGSLTVRENLRLASASSHREVDEQAREWLQSLPGLAGLERWMDVVADSVPYPVRKLTDMVRMLSALPRLALVDEPAAGLTSDERDLLVELLSSAREKLGCSIVLIEHDVPLVFRISDAVTVLSNGKLIAEGAPAEIRSHPEVIEAYLGVTV